MLAYHDSMSEYFGANVFRGSDNGTYRYAAAAYQEAILRFPDDSRIEYWQLGQATMMAISRDSDSRLIFQELLLDGLNNGRIFPTETDISNWLAQYPSRYSVQFGEIPPPPGYSGSYIIAIKSDFQAGGITFWILEDEVNFTAHILHNSLGYEYSSHYGFSIHNLSSPNANNVMITIGTHNGTFINADHIIYDLNQAVPFRLNFGPESSLVFNYHHDLTFDIMNDGREQLVIRQIDRFRPCSHFLIIRYEWRDVWFEQVGAEFELVGDFNPIDCLFDWLSFEYFSSLTNLERSAILEGIAVEEGKLEPDNRDEFRFYLALNHAILGNIEQAHEYFQSIVDTPVTENNEWIESAQSFLDHYETAENLFPACRQAAPDICRLHEVFISSVASLPPMTWSQLQNQIFEWGIIIEAGSTFDFDRDGESEHWLLLQHPQENHLYQLYIFAQWGGGWQAIPLWNNAALAPEFQIRLYYPS